MPFPTFKEFDTTLQPGQWQGFGIEKASVDRAFVAAYSFDKSVTNAGFLEKQVFQPEWDGKQWNTVLRLQMSNDVKPMGAKVRVYAIQKSYDVPVVADFTTTLQPGEWQGRSMGPSTVKQAYVAAFSPYPPSKNSGFLEKHVFQPEWDGRQWNTVLRMQIPKSEPALKMQVRVFAVAKAPVAREFSTTLKAGEWRGYSLGPASVDRGFLTAYSPGKPPVNRGFLEKHVVQPEWDGKQWNSVMRMQISQDLPYVEMTGRAFTIEGK